MSMLYDYRVRQRDFLLEISRAMTAQLDINEVLRLVLNASVVMLSGEVGLIALREPNGAYRIRATIGIEGQQLEQVNAQLQSLVDDESGILDASQVNAKIREMASSLDPRLKQSIALPLSMGQEAHGILIVFRAYRGSASTDDIQVLQSFADQAAIAVHNARLYANIEQERRRLAAIQQHSADGIMILDEDLVVDSFNRALERMTGWRAENAVGRHLSEIVQWKRLETKDIGDYLRDGWPFSQADSDYGNDRTLYVEGDIVRSDGVIIGIGITYAPLVTRGRDLANIIANVRDITNFRRAQEMQNMFISTVSHELRTPITLIKGYAGTLSRDDLEWNETIVRKSMTVIEDEADRLTSLVDNLITASKIQARSQLDINLSPTQIDFVAQTSLERFASQNTKHRFVSSFDDSFPIVQADEVRIRQVIDNLLANAVKYSPNGGTIEVGGNMQADHVTVYVRDEGIGMSDAEQERLFERFYRADNVLSRKTQGTGLGLYLSRAIVQAHGGVIDVDSSPGAGSIFYFTIPR